MIRGSYRLPFKIAGIPVHLDLTFLLILPVLAWLIGSQLSEFVRAFRLDLDPEPLSRGLKPYLLGLAAAVGLFVSILIHELGHSLVGRVFHLKIRSITLWILGGMAQFERMPRRKGAEALMAIAGPLTSLLVGGVTALLLTLAPSSLAGTRFVLAYLMYMNLVLALFNLLPALPLDGGRVLRSLLALRLPFIRATQISASLSRAIAILLGLLGFLSVNVWLILLAFFIYIAVASEAQHASVSTVLKGIHVRDLMTREVHTVPETMPVVELVHRMFSERFLAYPVLDGQGRPSGMVTLQDVRRARSEGREESSTTVAEVMSRRVERIHESASAVEAFQQIARSDSGRLIVVDGGGALKGILSKTDLVRAVQVRMVESGWEDTEKAHI